ncbi:GyrI-like domain-containing protein [Lysinibacillus halotolerans]|uniref:AraC family transcriptional regulator n=1 Tax=Lysinibacillus halotolerans TaxID=1368476 RepID=A0A3M8HFG3_9BACI|nr:GyrI-like domain-containing protein [Lysinibacillus halotolerans]RND01206.1 AraC family transcriptional regulator [Lysinibacillus halotolerans]
MGYKKERKVFRAVGLKGFGAFNDYGKEVPKLAQQLLVRKNEITNSADIEIGIFEPKRDADHLEGYYYAGLIVNESIKEVPVGMEYIEREQDYVSTRGNIQNLNTLHQHLLEWANEQGYQRDLTSDIIETYHPLINGGEEVEIYLPIQV